MKFMAQLRGSTKSLAPFLFQSEKYRKRKKNFFGSRISNIAVECRLKGSRTNFTQQYIMKSAQKCVSCQCVQSYKELPNLAKNIYEMSTAQEQPCYMYIILLVIKVKEIMFLTSFDNSFKYFSYPKEFFLFSREIRHK